jgi:hypothetical protein
MAVQRWYYAKDGKQVGPVTSDELRKLASSDELRREDLVWLEGTPNWVSAGSVTGLFAEAAPPPPPPPRSDDRRYHVYHLLLDLIRNTFDQRFVDRVSLLFGRTGYYALFAAMGVGLVLTLVVGAKTDSVRLILMGLSAILLVSVLQYAAKEFLAALDRLNKTTQARMASAAFLNCFALVNILGGVFAVVGLGYVAIRSGRISPRPAVAFHLTPRTPRSGHCGSLNGGVRWI